MFKFHYAFRLHSISYQREDIEGHGARLQMTARLPQGFTIIELMITILVASVLAMIAVPSYRNLTMNNCLTTTANSLVSAFQYARSEAVLRRDSVRISATDSSDSANEWGKGWIVQGREDPASAWQTLRQFELSCGQPTIDETGGSTQFVYDGSGFINKAGEFNLCDERSSEEGRQVELSITGRPGTSDHSCS